MSDEPSVDDAPVVRFVNKVLLESIKKGAGEIHLERGDGEFVVSFSIDGEAHEIARPPPVLWAKIVARLKVMARMVDYGPSKSADGRILLELSKTRTEEFLVDGNPDPVADERVVIVCKGTI